VRAKRNLLPTKLLLEESHTPSLLYYHGVSKFFTTMRVGITIIWHVQLYDQNGGVVMG